MLVTESDGTVTVWKRWAPLMLCTSALPVRPRPSVFASSSESTVRSAPVSTTKLNGPCPPMLTGTVMRRDLSAPKSTASLAGGGDAGSVVPAASRTAIAKAFMTRSPQRRFYAISRRSTTTLVDVHRLLSERFRLDEQSFVCKTLRDALAADHHEDRNGER